MAKFKVGDSVRALDSCGSGGFVEGHEYTVSRVYEDFAGPRISVAVDSIGSTSNGWGEYHFELAPLRIEAGKYYRTRDGRKVGPMYGPTYSLYWEGKAMWCGDESYGMDGRIFDDHESDLDLIAEWPTYTGNPAAEVDNLRDEYGPVGANDNGTETKFKVGDRVKFVDDYGGSARGKEATVIKLNVWGEGKGIQVDRGGGLYGISTEHAHSLRLVAPATSSKFKVGDRVRILRHENNHGDHIKKDLPIGSTHTIDEITNQIPGVQCCILSGSERHFYTPKDLELVSTSPAIVALIEDGQPKPAERPFVHPSREAASKEARRLAGKHRGREFGVYELVDTAQEEAEHEWQRLALAGRQTEAVDALVKQAGIARQAAYFAVRQAA